MPGHKEKSIAALYVELVRFGQIDEYERALKTCNKILSNAPTEGKAMQSKAVCLIHLGRFDEALQLILKNPEFTSEMYFEKAYCQYRVDQPEKALVTLYAAPELTHQLAELKAQIFYRLEQYDECYAVYFDIFKNISDEFNDERLANLNATIANLAKVQVPDTSIVTYENLFNIAFQLIEKEQFVEAEKKLKQCEKMFRDTLKEDGCTDEEIEYELGIVKIQLAFCYHRQNRIKEAHQLNSSVLKVKPDNVALVAVASNNAVVMNKDQNIFDSKRKIKYATQESLENKLNSSQRKIIALNHCLLSYNLNLLEQCTKLCDKMIAKWPDMTMDGTIVKALVLEKEENVAKAVEILEELCVSHPEQKLFIQLTIVHILLCQDEKSQACDVLYKLCNEKFSPGIVGALVTIYMGLNDEPRAAKVFEDAIAWYHGHQECQGDLSNMWMQAAEFHMRHGHPAIAAKSLEELLKKNTDDQRTIAQLIMAYVQFDIETARVYSEKLPSLEELTSALDPEELEATPIYGNRTPRSRSDHSPGTPNNELIERRKHRSRRRRLPKDYNLEVGPDMERWLPKYDRVGYRKKSNRRSKEVIKGSQGMASSSATDLLDFTKVAEKSDDSVETVDSNNGKSRNSNNGRNSNSGKNSNNGKSPNNDKSSDNSKSSDSGNVDKGSDNGKVANNDKSSDNGNNDKDSSNGKTLSNDKDSSNGKGSGQDKSSSNGKRPTSQTKKKRKTKR